MKKVIILITIVIGIGAALVSQRFFEPHKTATVSFNKTEQPKQTPEDRAKEINSYDIVWGYYGEYAASFTILDVIPEVGCRIRSSYDKDDIFILGLFGYSDRTYNTVPLVLRKEGSFTYKTVTGTTRVIPRYKLLPAELKTEWYSMPVHQKTADYRGWVLTKGSAVDW